MRKEKRENETQIGNRNVLGFAAPPALSRLQLCSGERADLSQDPPWGLRAWPLPLTVLFSVPSWHAVIVDGHSVEELCKAFGQAKHQPTAIIAKTFKGRGIDHLTFPSISFLILNESNDATSQGR